MDIRSLLVEVESELQKYQPSGPAAELDGKELVAAMRQQFRDIPFKWTPFVSAGPVVLPAPAGAELYAASARLVGLVHRAVRSLGAGPLERHRRLHLDPRLEVLYQDVEFEDRHAAPIARPDVLLTAEGWKFVEVNACAGVGGPTWVHLFNDLWRGLLPQDALRDLSLERPFEARNAMLLRVAKELGAAPRVAVIGCAEYMKLPTLRYYGVEIEQMRGAGIEADYFEPEEFLRATAGNPGSAYPIGLQRCVPQEFLEGGRDIAPLAAMRRTGTAVIASQSSYQLSSKAVLAMLSGGQEWMTESDREFVDRYVPWSRILSDRPVSFQGESRNMRALLEGERERFVLKRTDSNRGNGVFMGSEMPADAWRDVLDGALASGAWIAQERVVSTRIPVHLVEPGSGRPIGAEAPAVFGPVVIDGEPAGCMVRYDLSNGDDVISFDKAQVLMNSVAWSGALTVNGDRNP